MDLLLWLQSIRTPALDAFFLLVTKLGEDTFLLLPILLFYWCLDKRIGLRLGFIAFFSSIANQTTKLIFRVERPFVQNPALQPVEGARAGATGYSFPSGHSTSATSLGMALILTFRKKWWIWLCSILYVALVCFSRLYLGVHTPADVLTGFLMTVVVSLIVHALFNDSDKHPERKDLYLILSMLLSLGALAWGLVVVSTGLAPAELSVDIFKIAGAALGMLIGVELDRHFVHFEVKAPLWMQIVKVVLGVLITLGLRAGMKALLGPAPLMEFLRYLLTLLFISIGWPALFNLAVKKFAK